MADNPPPPPRSPIHDRAALAKKVVQSKIEKIAKGTQEALDKRHDLISGFRQNRSRADVEQAVKAFLVRNNQEESDDDVKARVDWMFEVLQSGDEVAKTGVQSFIKMMVEDRKHSKLLSVGSSDSNDNSSSLATESFESSEEASFATPVMAKLTAAPRDTIDQSDSASVESTSSWNVNDYGEIRSTKKYCSLDVGWGTCMLQMMSNWKSSLKHLFKDNPATVTVNKPSIRLALVGDWGTGPKSDFPTSSFSNIKRILAQRCVSQSLYYTIHLGDVYYAGTPEEEQANFISHWPVPRPTGRSFALNSNHEMYNKHGFFETALGDIKFAAQQGTSYFAIIINNTWLVFGLDSAWDASGSTYMDGNLTDSQKTFIIKTRTDYPSINKFIIMTHHDPIDLEGSKLHPLYKQVKDTLGAEPTYWFYGHVHNGIVYKPGTAGVSTLFRCSGHGAFPYGYTKKLLVSTVDWFEDKTTDNGARCRNGYVEVELDNDSLIETWICELGEERVVYRDGVRQGDTATSTSSSSTST